MIADTLRHAMNWGRRILRERHVRRQLRDEEWRGICMKHDIPLDKVALAPDGSLSLELTNSRLRLPKAASAYRVLSAYSILTELDAYTDCRVSWDEPKSALLLTSGGAKYWADSFEELFVLREICFSGDYDFAPAKPTVIVDVGAHVGFTLIFLANANPDVMAVGCEPLPASYLKAIDNVRNNPDLSARIKVHNFGLSSTDGKQFLKSEYGKTVESRIVDRSDDSNDARDFVPVEVRRASSFIQEVRELHPGRRIVIKMDCEGSEYRILRDLEAGAALPMISGFLMEWHKFIDQSEDGGFLRDFFPRHGFDVCLLGRLQSRDKVGMAYAFRAIPMST